MKLIITSFFCIALFSCSLKTDRDFIKNRFWKYGEGFCAKTDILILKNKNFRNDTIFDNEKPIAIFVRLEDFKSDLIIKSISNNKIGTYHDQGKINENQ